MGWGRMGLLKRPEHTQGKPRTSTRQTKRQGKVQKRARDGEGGLMGWQDSGKHTTQKSHVVFLNTVLVWMTNICQFLCCSVALEPGEFNHKITMMQVIKARNLDMHRRCCMHRSTRPARTDQFHLGVPDWQRTPPLCLLCVLSIPCADWKSQEDIVANQHLNAFWRKGQSFQFPFPPPT